MNKFLEFIGGRKFFMFIVGTVALFAGKISGTEWVALAGAFAVGNAAEHFANRKNHNP